MYICVCFWYLSTSFVYKIQTLQRRYREKEEQIFINVYLVCSLLFLIEYIFFRNANCLFLFSFFIFLVPTIISFLLLKKYICELIFRDI